MIDPVSKILEDKYSRNKSSNVPGESSYKGTVTTTKPTTVTITKPTVTTTTNSTTTSKPSTTTSSSSTKSSSGTSSSSSTKSSSGTSSSSSTTIPVKEAPNIGTGSKEASTTAVWTTYDKSSPYYGKQVHTNDAGKIVPVVQYLPGTTIPMSDEFAAKLAKSKIELGLAPDASSDAAIVAIAKGDKFVQELVPSPQQTITNQKQYVYTVNPEKTETTLYPTATPIDRYQYGASSLIASPFNLPEGVAPAPIPKKYWGTSSAEYGEVNASGVQIVPGIIDLSKTVSSYGTVPISEKIGGFSFAKDMPESNITQVPLNIDFQKLVSTAKFDTTVSDKIKQEVTGQTFISEQLAKQIEEGRQKQFISSTLDEAKKETQYSPFTTKKDYGTSSALKGTIDEKGERVVSPELTSKIAESIILHNKMIGSVSPTSEYESRRQLELEAKELKDITGKIYKNIDLTTIGETSNTALRNQVLPTNAGLVESYLATGIKPRLTVTETTPTLKENIKTFFETGKIEGPTKSISVSTGFDKYSYDKSIEDLKARAIKLENEKIKVEKESEATVKALEPVISSFSNKIDKYNEDVRKHNEIDTNNFSTQSQVDKFNAESLYLTNVGEDLAAEKKLLENKIENVNVENKLKQFEFNKAIVEYNRDAEKTKSLAAIGLSDEKIADGVSLKDVEWSEGKKVTLSPWQEYVKYQKELDSRTIGEKVKSGALQVAAGPFAVFIPEVKKPYSILVGDPAGKWLNEKVDKIDTSSAVGKGLYTVSSFGSGAVKEVIQNPEKVALLYGVGALTGGVAPVLAKGATAVASKIVGKALAPSIVSYGGKALGAGMLGLGALSTASELAASKNKAETLGKIGVDFAAMGIGYKTISDARLKSLQPQVESIKPKTRKTWKTGSKEEKLNAIEKGIFTNKKGERINYEAKVTINTDTNEGKYIVDMFKNGKNIGQNVGNIKDFALLQKRNIIQMENGNIKEIFTTITSGKFGKGGLFPNYQTVTQRSTSTVGRTKPITTKEPVGWRLNEYGDVVAIEPEVIGGSYKLGTRTATRIAERGNIFTKLVNEETSNVVQTTAGTALQRSIKTPFSSLVYRSTPFKRITKGIKGISTLPATGLSGGVEGNFAGMGTGGTGGTGVADLYGISRFKSFPSTVSKLPTRFIIPSAPSTEFGKMISWKVESPFITTYISSVSSNEKAGIVIPSENISSSEYKGLQMLGTVPSEDYTSKISSILGVSSKSSTLADYITDYGTTSKSISGVDTASIPDVTSEIITQPDFSGIVGTFPGFNIPSGLIGSSSGLSLPEGPGYSYRPRRRIKSWTTTNPFRELGVEWFAKKEAEAQLEAAKPKASYESKVKSMLGGVGLGPTFINSGKSISDVRVDWGSKNYKLTQLKSIKKSDFSSNVIKNSMSKTKDLYKNIRSKI